MARRWLGLAVLVGMAACGGGGTGPSRAGSGDGGETPVCGDGVVDPGELCDDGNDVDEDTCTTACAPAECGDGIVWDELELCDDGNTVDGDGCSSFCEPETASFCGDGFTDEGEACDDGNDVDTDSCLSTCEDASCGDGHVWAGLEDCDDGNRADGDGCSATCQLEQAPPACGNGRREAGEQCDDGNVDDGDGCSATCEVETAGVCGDGVTDEGEECDDGDDDDTDFCLSSCVNAVCGDGFLWAEIEACDDGNTEELDTCSAACDEERELEIEVNDDVRWPDAISTGTVVLGSIAQGDVDHYAFLGIAGVTVELRAHAPVGESCDSSQRPVISVLDELGNEISEPVLSCGIGLYFTPPDTRLYRVRATPARAAYTPYTLSMF